LAPSDPIGHDEDEIDELGRLPLGELLERYTDAGKLGREEER
jgi:hypothetical protein